MIDGTDQYVPPGMKTNDNQQDELTHDLAEYLVFSILRGLRELKKLDPDHPLVKTLND